MEKSSKYKIYQLTIVFICLISIIGALVYRFYSFSLGGIIISWILILAFFVFFTFLFKKGGVNYADIEKKQSFKIKKADLILIVFYLFFLLLSFYALYLGRTAQALISPWQTTTKYFFVAYFSATLFLILLIAKKIKNSIFLIILHYFLSFSALWLVFKFGYGYDPFIHRATLEAIKENGLIMPKTWYYLGQYSLIFLLHKISFIPIVYLDNLLVPFLSALFLPPAILVFLKNNQPSQKIGLTIVFLLLLPFSFFTLSVPQNLAYLFLILTVFFSLNAKSKKEFIAPALLSVAAFLTHPIAGIPAILFAIFLFVHNLPFSKLKRIVYVFIFLSTIIILPALFYFFQSGESRADYSSVVTAETTKKISILPALENPAEENFILNFVYLFSKNFWLILLALIIATGIFAYKKRIENRKLTICFSFFICLLAAHALIKELDFKFLIDYERQDYGLRVLKTAIIFLLPVFTLLFQKIIEKISKENKFIKISALLFFISLLTASVYLSYPRKDNYHNSRGFSVGQSDFDAVELIEKNSQEKYIVLANQQVSAAALARFGFSKYYNNFYFYPIPTGGPLYQYYLEMVYKKPSRQTAQTAMDLAGVNVCYFVLNKYWWAFDKILEEAKAEADSFESLENKEIYIFKYTK